MRKALLIFNPRSGGNRFNQLDLVLERFKYQKILTQAFCLSESGNDERMINTLTRHHFDLVVISGGDGTINFIVNVLLKNNIQLPIGIIPAGTSNDLARNLKLPLDQKKAVDQIAFGSTVSIDVGLVNETTYFLSSCAGGLFTDISYKTEEDLKKSLGPLAYYLKGIQEFTRIQPFKLIVKTNGNVIEEDILLFFILNGPNVAGLSDLIQNATPTDGYLHLILIKKCDPVDLTGIFFNILGHFSLKDNEKVKIISAPEFELMSNHEIVLSVDGEKSGTLPAKLIVKPNKLTLFSPFEVVDY